MKKAIATIKNEIGEEMTIYFNGINEEMTAENDNRVEEIGSCPESEKEAFDDVYWMFYNPIWELEFIAEYEE